MILERAGICESISVCGALGGRRWVGGGWRLKVVRRFPSGRMVIHGNGNGKQEDFPVEVIGSFLPSQPPPNHPAPPHPPPPATWFNGYISMLQRYSDGTSQVHQITAEISENREGDGVMG